MMAQLAGLMLIALYSALQLPSGTSQKVVYHTEGLLEPARLPCRVNDQSAKPLNVTWQTPGRLTVRNDGSRCEGRKYCFSRTDDTYDLLVSDVKKEDEGRYICNLVFTDTTSRRHLVLIILGPPTIVSMENHQGGNGLVLGQKSWLGCVVSGSEVVISWTVNGSPAEGESVFNGSRAISVLQVFPKEEDENVLVTCRARNNAGSAERTLRMTVLYSPRNVTIIQGTNITVTEGANTTLECTARGKPAPFISWSGKIPLSAVTFSNGEIQSSSLLLPHIRRSSSGVLTCTATNSQSAHIEGEKSASIYLEVLYAPDKPHLSTESDIYAVGSNINIKCLASDTGKPEGILSWTKDGHALHPAGGLATLLITQATLNATGSYRCRISNNFGINESDPLDIAVLGVPETPTNVSASSNWTSVTLRWESSVANDSYHSFSVTLDGSPACNTRTTSCTITGLMHSKTYAVSVIAVNAVLSSHPSEAVVTTTWSIPSKEAIIFLGPKWVHVNVSKSDDYCLSEECWTDGLPNSAFIVMECRAVRGVELLNMSCSDPRLKLCVQNSIPPTCGAYLYREGQAKGSLNSTIKMIAGVVSCVLGVTTVVFLVFFFVRRRAKARSAAIHAMTSAAEEKLSKSDESDGSNMVYTTVDRDAYNTTHFFDEDEEQPSIDRQGSRMMSRSNRDYASIRRKNYISPTAVPSAPFDDDDNFCLADADPRMPISNDLSLDRSLPQSAQVYEEQHQSRPRYNGEMETFHA